MPVLTILADVNAEGQLRRLDRILRGPIWGELWSALDPAVETFEGLGVDRDSPDSAIWPLCQRLGIVLFTANRNDDGPDSLEATIRESVRADSLPVLTIADPRRLLEDRPYAERAAVRLLEILIDLDAHRGTGRLDLP